jgi:catechol 2,3-dioxygenase-like lactoylglutathione lyase family enzyme
VAAATIDELTRADEAAAWERLGFTASDGCLQLGSVRLRLSGQSDRAGILGWSLRGLKSAELDGLPTRPSERPPPDGAAVHPNGALGVDHVVAMSPDLDRSIAALQAAGLDLRRVREQPTPAGGPRQAFFKLGEEILEVVQIPAEALARAGGRDAPAFFWGLALTVSDLDAVVAQLGEDVGGVRAAVQPGRRIATLRRSAGLSVPVALMSTRSVEVAA